MDCAERNSRKKSQQVNKQAGKIIASTRGREIRKVKKENDSLICEKHDESMMKMMENEGKSKGSCIDDNIRTVRLRQKEANSKLGFSLRGGKEATGSSVGVFVSHVESCSEAQKKGLKIGDQLIQVNGLSVNQATYEDVIGLIKKSSRACDIILCVQYQARIPFQERAGDPIRWLPVGDANREAGSENEDEDEDEDELLEVSYEDEGIESYKSCAKRGAEGGGNSLLSSRRSSGSSDGSASSSDGQEGEGRVEGSRQESGAGGKSSSGGDSAVSSALASSSSVDSQSTRSLSSITSLSLAGSSSLNSQVNLDSYQANSLEDSALVLIMVAGGRSSDEPFGCGVVKGPEEWPGIFVQTVKPDSLADRAGLEPGDQLIQAAGQPLAGLPFEDAIRLIKRLQGERDELELQVRKGAALRYLAADRLAATCPTHNPQVTESSNSSSSNSDTQRHSGDARKQQQQPHPSVRVVKGKQQCAKASESTQVNDECADSNKWLTERQPLKTKVMANQVERSSSTFQHSDEVEEENQCNVNEQHSKLLDASLPYQKPIKQHHAESRHKILSGSSGETSSLRAKHHHHHFTKEASHLPEEVSSVSCREMPVHDDTERRIRADQRNRQVKPSAQLRPATRFGAAASKQKARECRGACRLSPAPEDEAEEAGKGSDEREEGEEEIRIVSQNCKLHHHQSQTSQFKSSQLLAEKFRNHELHEQLCSSNPVRQVEHHQQRSSRAVLSALPVRSSCSSRSAAATEMRHPVCTDSNWPTAKTSCSRSVAKGGTHLARYLSMENIAISSGGCGSAMSDHQHPSTSCARSSVGCRLLPATGAMNYHYAKQQQQHRSTSRHYLAQQPVQASTCYFSPIDLQHKQQLYRRSSSVLGQAAPTCCRRSSVQQQPPVRRVYSRTSHLAPSSPARLTKARSMDKLNMSINLSYLKIGLSSNQQQQQQQQQLKQQQYVGRSALSNKLQRCQQYQSCCSSVVYPNTHPLSPSSLESSCPECPINELQASNVDSYQSSLIQQLVGNMAAAATCRSEQLLPGPRGLASGSECICGAFLAAPRGMRELPSPSKRPQVTSSSSGCCLACYSSNQARRHHPSQTCAGAGHIPTSSKSSKLLRQHYEPSAAGHYSDLQALSCGLAESVYAAGQSTCEQHDKKSLNVTQCHNSQCSAGIHSAQSHVLPITSRHQVYPVTPQSHVQAHSRAHLQTKACPPPPPPLPLASNSGTARPARQLTTFLASSGHQASRLNGSGSVGGSTGNTPPSSLSASSVSSSSYSALSPTTSSSSCSRQSASPPEPPVRRLASSSSGQVSAPPPCPPPLPAADADFERKVALNLRAAASNCQQVTTGSPKKQQSDDSALKMSGTSGGERLCFVDELKMLANKQDAAGIQESSTLIKIINASKQANRNEREATCGCQQQVDQRKVLNRCSSGDNLQQQQAYLEGASSKGCCWHAKKVTGKQSAGAAQPGNRLKYEDQDNKRRQHEMLMKEFKSAHSRMFKRRQAGNGSSNEATTEGRESPGKVETNPKTDLQEQDLTTCAVQQKQQQQQVKKKDPAPPPPPPQKSRDSPAQDKDRAGEKAAARVIRHTTIKTIQTKKAPINLLLSKAAQQAPALHLAAAN